MSATCWRCGQPADAREGVRGRVRPVCLGCARDQTTPISDAVEIVTSTRAFIAEARASGRRVVELTIDSRAEGGDVTSHILDVDELERVNETFARERGVA